MKKGRENVKGHNFRKAFYPFYCNDRGRMNRFDDVLAENNAYGLFQGRLALLPLRLTQNLSGTRHTCHMISSINPHR